MLTPTPSRTAVVTGAARGIGAAVARRLAAAGRQVAVLDRDEAACGPTVAAIAEAGGIALAGAVDVADERSVRAAVGRVARELGPPTILVNNAGIAHVADLVETRTRDWDDVLAVDLRGAFLAARETCPAMRASGWGRVVNVSSVSAHGDAGRVAYASAKAGLHGLTKSLALELGPEGITCNAVAPGFVVSAMTAATAARLGRSFDEHQRITAEAIAVRRVGRPEDVAEAVAFLTGEGAGYVSGQILEVAGGPAG